MSKNIKMHYPDDSMHDIRALQLVHYIKNDEDKYVLHYYDCLDKKEKIALLEKKDNTFFKKPLSNKKDYAKLSKEEVIMLLSGKAQSIGVDDLPEIIELTHHLSIFQSQMYIIVYYDDQGNYYKDIYGKEMISKSIVLELQNKPEYFVEFKPIVKAIMKSIVTIYRDTETNRYFVDADGKMEISLGQLEAIKADPRLEIQYRPVRKFKIKINDLPPKKPKNFEIVRTEEETEASPITIYSDNEGNHYVAIGIPGTEILAFKFLKKLTNYEYYDFIGGKYKVTGIEIEPIDKISLFSRNGSNFYLDKKICILNNNRCFAIRKPFKIKYNDESLYKISKRDVELILELYKQKKIKLSFTDLDRSNNMFNNPEDAPSTSSAMKR